MGLTCARWLSIVGVVLAAGCGGPAPSVTGDAGVVTTCINAAQCDDGLYCNGAETCDPTSASAGPDGCVPDPTGAPCIAGQVCDEAHDRCITSCSVSEDADGDGVRAIACGGTDCDDADAHRFPGNAEICDVGAHDEDCDDTTFGDRDLDGDGVADARCCNGTNCGADCNDLLRGSNPTAPEVCDHLDNDCDGSVDEGGVTVMVWPDADFDLHGDAMATPHLDCAGTFGTATLGDDCRDDDPAVQPAQVEICDTKDNDCDGRIDESPAAVTWYVDADGDGFGSASETRISCTPLPGYALRGSDCDDHAAGVSPGQFERCDGLDNDCNGRPDYVLGPHDTEDDDLDHAADLACPSGTDCNDADPTSYPAVGTVAAAPELCDLRDNDCNGMVDDGTAMGAWYPDVDGDTFGDASATAIMSCTFVRGHVPRPGDCDDTSAERRPGRAETCDGADQDCDGAIDETSERSPFYLDADGDGLGAGTPTLACTMPVDRVANAVDCDDTNRAVGAAQLWFVDADADGYGDPARSTLSCTAIAGQITRGGDCDDAMGTTHPMATERCSGTDEDCDGALDESPAESSCSVAYATPSCVAGVCGVATCASAHQDCDHDATNGCEVATDTDAANCGACGMVCPMGAACRGGACATIRDLALGRDFACALLGTGRVACWGHAYDGQLGRGIVTYSDLPPPTSDAENVQLYTMDTLTDAIAVDAGVEGEFACALRMDGTVWCWGVSTSGQVGTLGPPISAQRAYPIAGITGATAISVGQTHACAIVGGGRVLCWGNNAGGRLGSGSTIPATSPTPLPMVQLEGGVTAPITDAIAIVAANEQTCVLHAGSLRVSCAGQEGSGGGWTGQLGRGLIPAGAYPVADDVHLPAGTITSLQAGSDHFCVLFTSGPPVCWGLNSGQIQVGPPYGVTTPVALDALLSSPLEIALGFSATCTRYVHPTRGVRVACTGNDSSGQLGDGAIETSDVVLDDVVTAADRSTFLTTAVRLYLGYQISCALLDTGRITCWGLNANARFGTSTPYTRSFVDLTTSVPNVP